jgi:hypothetical protein
MAGPLPGARTADTGIAGRLDSWKAVAAYLKRDVTTVQRWERREGLPVHRHLHDKRGSVYALASELDAWRESRGALFERAPTAAETPAKSQRSFWTRRSLAVAALIVLAVAAVPYLVLHRGRAPNSAGPEDLVRRVWSDPVTASP